MSPVWDMLNVPGICCSETNSPAFSGQQEPFGFVLGVAPLCSPVWSLSWKDWG